MKTPILLRTPDEAQAWCDKLRESGSTIGLVPTMGALHEGHLGLVRRAAAENDCAVVSIFVNPLQFDEAEDLARYPRNLSRDAKLVGEADCAMVFSGSLGGFFPGAGLPREASDLCVTEGQLDRIPRRTVGAVGAGLEGAFRKGHFEGVATIVARLFELVQPTRAYFGAKDYQQTLVVREVALDFQSLEIVVCATSREADGLARSSRNTHLDPASRRSAVALSRALFLARALWRQGERDPDRLVQGLTEALGTDGIEIEYAEVRDPDAWTAERPRTLGKRARALVAARVGSVRLIDNLALDEASVRAEEGDSAWDNPRFEPKPSR